MGLIVNGELNESHGVLLTFIFLDENGSTTIADGIAQIKLNYDYGILYTGEINVERQNFTELIKKSVKETTNGLITFVDRSVYLSTPMIPFSAMLTDPSNWVQIVKGEAVVSFKPRNGAPTFEATSNEIILNPAKPGGLDLDPYTNTEYR